MLPKEQLIRLIASKDDNAGHHMLWVSIDGDVLLDTIPKDQSPVGYAKSLEERIQFRLETMMAGNGYVGTNAARDEKWVDRLYTALLKYYEGGLKGYIDMF